MSIFALQRHIDEAASSGRAGQCLLTGHRRRRGALWLIALALVLPLARGQSGSWQPLGPMAVQSQNYGLVSGRVTALALDPSDATGNTLYVGTTGGGVWKSQNAMAGANAVFLPLTDALAALSNVPDASISIGAVTVQPGGAGVILAGTGDPNDALDSYYGAGILRSADGGATWSLIASTSILATPLYSFAGEAFAGFAWSTSNPQIVVAAVSEAREGALVNALRQGKSCEGLYYSQDAGATWTLATITDGAGEDVQGQNDRFALPDGNAATSVVWNPARKLFVAAVRYHGYYQSADAITFTRLANQPGTTGLSGLTTAMCPTNSGGTGAPGCPIYRGTLAVNPVTGDTFAWTVNAANQDQGIWQDVCSASGGGCASQTMSFGQQWDTTALEANTWLGAATIEEGDYNLALAAIPSGQETMLLAGANDLWKSMCPVTQGCAWRNTTNSTVGFCAKVGEYQHALAWNAQNPLEIFAGNDSGLWISSDGIDETGQACTASDETHFQNLNGGLGSLAEVTSFAQAGATPYTLLAGLGENGTAGVNSGIGPMTDWPEILSGEGGPVAVDPVNPLKWYVNNGPGVSIELGSPPTGGTTGAFNPVLSFMTAPTADVVKDGYAMSTPAPFLLDPLDHSQLLIGTCRVWRGPANGVGWSVANAISPIGVAGSGAATVGVDCNGEGLIRSLAAMALPDSAALPQGGEVVYAGMYGAANGGATLGGHVLSATNNTAAGAWSAWTDVTALNPVVNDTNAMNAYRMDISSIYIDPHDTTGKTVYVTVAGIPSHAMNAQMVYGSTDGGGHWTDLTSNLPATPANSVVVDPQDASTVYVATDAGVYSTRGMANESCNTETPGCWAIFGSGLPESPVTEISAEPATASVHDLIAATYGRGIWVTPLWTAGEEVTTATASPTLLTFVNPVEGGATSTLPVILKNTGSLALTPSYIVANGDFTESDNCAGESVPAGQSCTIAVSFSPTLTGSRSGLLTIYTNVTGGQLTVALSGTGAPSGTVTLTPGSINFGSLLVGTPSTPWQVTVNNSGSPAVAFNSSINGPFVIASNGCGSSVAAKGSCNMTVSFTPAKPGSANGTLTLTDATGTQTVTLSGTGLAPATDGLSTSMLNFPATIEGQLSTAETVTLTNSGGVDLTSIQISIPAGESFVLGGSTGQTSPCTATLAGNSSCTVTLEFAPTSAGSLSGTLTIADALHTQKVTLSGTGLTPPVFGMSPSTGLTFLGQTVGQTSQAQTVTVTNTGGAPMTISGYRISGTNASSFSCGTTTCSAMTCGTTLSNVIGQNSCTVQVSFTPAAAGAATATLVVTSSTAGVAAASVALNGTGLTPASLSVSPSAGFTYAGQTMGKSSQAQTMTVTNTGQSPANSLTLSATSPFSLTENTCGASLAAGASCTTGVIFSPTLSHAYTGTVTIASPSLAASTVVPLSGTGLTPAALNVNPAAGLNFPGQTMGQASQPLTMTVTNTGQSPANSLTLTATSPFSLTQDTCGQILAAGASCSTGVVFTPSLSQGYTGTLTIASPLLAASTVVPLSGTGLTLPAFSISPTAGLTFAGQTVGQASQPQTVTVTNTGGSPLTISGYQISGTNAASFTCGTTACSATSCGTTLSNVSGQNSCTVQITFTPTMAGTASAMLVISSSTTGVAAASITLSGSGTTPGVLKISPAAGLTFAGQTVGQTSQQQTVTVTNTGGSPLSISGFQMTGTDAASFSCGATACSATTCGTTLSNVSGQNSCTVQVSFTPAAAGTATATLVVNTSTAGVAAASVALNGTGLTPAEVDVNPPQIGFSVVVPGQSSVAQTVTVKNTGGSTATSLTLMATPPFSLTQNTCGTSLGGSSLAGGASCSTGVVFTPNLSQAYTGTLTIASPSLAASTVVALKGTGQEPAMVQMQPGLIGSCAAGTSVNCFPQTGVGQVSAPVTVTLSNPSGGPDLTNFALASTVNFQLVNNTCATTLAAGTSCTVGVEFAPAATSTGAQSGSLSVMSSTLKTGAIVPLSGMGFDFTLAFSGVGSQTISSGQTAEYKLVITPLNGSAGAFTLQCGTLPSYSTCAFNPNSESISANTTGNEEVEIATGVASTTAQLKRSPSRIEWPLACGLTLVPFALYRRRKALLLMALLAVLVGGVTSCASSGSIPGGGGGGGGGGGSSTNTPSGSYSIPVTVSSNGIQHKITLTLEVD